MNEFDKTWLKAVGLYLGSIALVFVGVGLTKLPHVYWQVAWVMVKGAIPFAIAIVIAVYINQRINRS